MFLMGLPAALSHDILHDVQFDADDYSACVKIALNKSRSLKSTGH